MYVQIVRRAVAGLAIGALGVTGCMPAASTAAPTAGPTQGTATSPPSTAAASGTVKVTVQEFSVLPETPSTAVGEVTFEVTNNGPDDDHEFVVIKTDLAKDALPTKANGSVDEDGEGIEVIDEVEEFSPGETEELTVNLKAGSYVLICNVFEDSENESHYQNGMRTAFEVTG